jgi:hypothetical protein
MRAMTTLRSLALTVMGLMAIGGCAKQEDPVFICSADTCTGCCNGNDCVTPPDETACGTGGAACSPCRANEACNSGKCVPDSCAGCVDPQGLSCLPGTSTTACGVGGAFCAACGAGTVCNGGKCVSDACAGCKDGSGTCQPGTSNAMCGSAGDACAACTGSDTCQDKHCTPPAACNVGTCPTGCCDNMDQCKMGNTIMACGAGGNACQTCSGTGATCNSGTCKVPCGPDNCAGCCDSTGMCVASVNTACGLNGASCTACMGSDICSNGKCIATACKGTCPGCCNGSTCELGTVNGQCGISGNSCVACMGGTTCISNKCQVDPNSTWDFVVTSGTVPIYMNPPTNTTFWDSFGGAPDPYVEFDLSYGAATQQILNSDYVSDTYNPDWTGTSGKGILLTKVKASVLLAPGNNYLQIWDDDFGSDNDMGWCAFTISETMFNGTLQTFDCNPSNGITPGVHWTLKFKIVPHP